MLPLLSKPPTTHNNALLINDQQQLNATKGTVFFNQQKNKYIKKLESIDAMLTNVKVQRQHKW
jgi:cell division septal protein FtsQ